MIQMIASRSLRSQRSGRRGVAEIETLLVITLLLIPFMLLTAGLYRIGGARLTNVFGAENSAYTQVTDGVALNAAPGFDPIDGFSDVKPGLPNRTDLALLQSSIPMINTPSIQLAPTTITEQAAFLDPSWHYSNFAQPADEPVVYNWFASYVQEAVTDTLVNSLGLLKP